MTKATLQQCHNQQFNKMYSIPVQHSKTPTEKTLWPPAAILPSKYNCKSIYVMLRSAPLVRRQLAEIDSVR